MSRKVAAIRRTIPETVTLPADLFLEVLAHFEAIPMVLEEAMGQATESGDYVRDFGDRLEEVLGPRIVNEDEIDGATSDAAFETDPFTLKLEARGRELAVAMFRSELECAEKYGYDTLGTITPLGLRAAIERWLGKEEVAA